MPLDNNQQIDQTNNEQQIDQIAMSLKKQFEQFSEIVKILKNLVDYHDFMIRFQNDFTQAFTQINAIRQDIENYDFSDIQQKLNDLEQMPEQVKNEFEQFQQQHLTQAKNDFNQKYQTLSTYIENLPNQLSGRQQEILNQFNQRLDSFQQEKIEQPIQNLSTQLNQFNANEFEKVIAHFQIIHSALQQDEQNLLKKLDDIKQLPEQVENDFNQKYQTLYTYIERLPDQLRVMQQGALNQFNQRLYSFQQEKIEQPIQNLSTQLNQFNANEFEKVIAHFQIIHSALQQDEQNLLKKLDDIKQLPEQVKARFEQLQQQHLTQAANDFNQKYQALSIYIRENLPNQLGDEQKKILKEIDSFLDQILLQRVEEPIQDLSSQLKGLSSQLRESNIERIFQDLSSLSSSVNKISNKLNELSNKLDGQSEKISLIQMQKNDLERLSKQQSHIYKQQQDIKEMLNQQKEGNSLTDIMNKIKNKKSWW